MSTKGISWSEQNRSTVVAKCGLCHCEYIRLGTKGSFCYKCRTAFGGNDRCWDLYLGMKKIKSETARRRMLQKVYDEHTMRKRKTSATWMPASVFKQPAGEAREIAHLPKGSVVRVGLKYVRVPVLARKRAAHGLQQITCDESLGLHLQGKVVRTCKCCGRDYVCRSANQRVCGVCTAVFKAGKDRDYIMKQPPEDRARIYRSRVAQMKPGYIKDLLMPGLYDKWTGDKETDLRIVTVEHAINVLRIREAAKFKAMRARANRPVYEYKCALCGVITKTTTKRTEEDAPYVCENCKKVVDRKPYKGKVKGLQDMPLERIAQLPSYARAMYEQHMGVREKTKLHQLVLEKNRGRRSFSEELELS